jgi:hypothetical protein
MRTNELVTILYDQDIAMLPVLYEPIIEYFANLDVEVNKLSAKEEDLDNSYSVYCSQRMGAVLHLSKVELLLQSEGVL